MTQPSARTKAQAAHANPLVNDRPLAASVIVVCYQQAHVLELVVLGLLDQDFDGPWELIVVDDGSSDQTFETLRPHLQTDVGVALL